MQCPFEERLQAYLDEKLSSEELKDVESHLEQCSMCQKRLDALIDTPLEIPAEKIIIDDAVLVDKIKAHRKGIRRITLYGILGFVLGVFSRFYTMDSFIVTKAMMALPYKLAEFALGIFFSRYTLPQWDKYYHMARGGMGFFPHHPILEILAELITPGIVATFMAIMVGHLLSDKRVFRRKDIVKFLIAGILTFSLWAGMLYGVYSYNLNQIDQMRGIQSIIIYEEKVGSSSWLLRIDQYNLEKQEYSKILEELSHAAKTQHPAHYNPDVGYGLLLEFRGGGRMMGHLDKETGILIMQNRNVYQLSRETLGILDEISRREK